jgi:hypothetical protein
VLPRERERRFGADPHLEHGFHRDRARLREPRNRSRTPSPGDTSAPRRQRRSGSNAREVGASRRRYRATTFPLGFQ